MFSVSLTFWISTLGMPPSFRALRSWSVGTGAEKCICIMVPPVKSTPSFNPPCRMTETMVAMKRAREKA